MIDNLNTNLLKGSMYGLIKDTLNQYKVDTLVNTLARFDINVIDGVFNNTLDRQIEDQVNDMTIKSMNWSMLWLESECSSYFLNANMHMKVKHKANANRNTRKKHKMFSQKHYPTPKLSFTYTLNFYNNARRKSHIFDTMNWRWILLES